LAVLISVDRIDTRHWQDGKPIASNKYDTGLLVAGGMIVIRLQDLIKAGIIRLTS
jgi:hypothetical protein